MHDVVSILSPLVDAGIGVIAISLYHKLSTTFKAFEETQRAVASKLDGLDHRVARLETQR